MAEPMASASVKDSPRIHTANAMVINGEIVAIIEVDCGLMRDRPAFTRNDGKTVAKKPVPAASQKNRGLEEKSTLRLVTI